MSLPMILQKRPAKYIVIIPPVYNTSVVLLFKEVYNVGIICDDFKFRMECDGYDDAQNKVDQIDHAVKEGRMLLIDQEIVVQSVTGEDWL